MDLFEQISNDIKAAMLAKNVVKLEALRGVKKEFIEATTADGANGELSQSVALGILTKLVKQRKDVAQIYFSQNRADLAERELAEAAFLEPYLPKQMSEAELEMVLKKIIAETGATSAKDMGKVMGVATKQLAGKADGKIIMTIVKRCLAS
ncbi:MAG: GatB/YqeY domain-containing protein [Bacteroidales bacterium]